MRGRGFLGILLVVIGALIILNRYIDLSIGFSMWWPIIVIAIGVLQIIQRPSSPAAGVTIMIAGILLQLRKLDIIPGELLFPIILILAGLYFIFFRLKDRNRIITEDNINHFVMFSGLETRNRTKNFTGGSITAIFGGAAIDLRDAELSTEGASLDLTAAFGGVELRVPENWRVIIKGTPLFGGWGNKTRFLQTGGTEGPVLNVNCLALFGGAEIKN